MITRKPTKIELKSEDDIFEYEEYKQSTIKKHSIFKDVESNQYSPMRGKNSFKNSVGTDSLKIINSNISYGKILNQI